MMPVIIIRPQPGCAATLAAARRMGLPAHGFPMFEVRPLPWETPDPASVDALLIGSANAFRHGGAALSAFADKPVYAVGERTAEAARDAGFAVAATGEGTLQPVLDAVSPEHRRLLRLCGEQRVEVIPPADVTVIERQVYASDPLPMPPALIALLREPALVLLHSAEAARHFAQSCDANVVDRAQIALATIAPRAAQAAGEGWADVQSADRPADDALLALARNMCQTTRRPVDRERTAMQDSSGSHAMQHAPSRRWGQGLLLVGLVAFVCGVVLAGWLAWRGHLDTFLPDSPARVAAQNAAGTASGGNEASSNGGAAGPERPLEAITSVEARVAMLEDRISRLNLQAAAASGHAARAENLLIAFAARRMIDRGDPLRYLATQLRLRFADTQPHAVKTVIEFAEKPVTLDQLSARLEALSPQLTGVSRDESFWEQAVREISGLFTVRREPSELRSPEARLERARVMLRAGKVQEAVNAIERLPEPQVAEKWISDAKRYDAVQRALDVIETTAMLEPRRVQNSEGSALQQSGANSAPDGASPAEPEAVPAEAAERERP